MVTFNPDTIYGTNGEKVFFRYYRDSIRIADHNFVYRNSDIEKYENLGLTNVSILRSFFVPKQLENLCFKKFDEKSTDVGFYGHCEPDMRIEYAKSLFQAGFDLKINGRDWNKYYTHKEGIKK
mgnify:FL=1